MKEWERERERERETCSFRQQERIVNISVVALFSLSLPHVQSKVFFFLTSRYSLFLPPSLFLFFPLLSLPCFYPCFCFNQFLFFLGVHVFFSRTFLLFFSDTKSLSPCVFRILWLSPSLRFFLSFFLLSLFYPSENFFYSNEAHFSGTGGPVRWCLKKKNWNKQTK